MATKNGHRVAGARSILIVLASTSGCEVDVEPTLFAQPCRVESLATGYSFTWARKADGSVWRWGHERVPRSAEELLSHEFKRNAPQREEGVTAETAAIFSRSNSLCQLTHAGALNCAAGSDTVSILTGVKRVALGVGLRYYDELGHEDCAQTVDDSVWCWTREDKNSALWKMSKIDLPGEVTELASGSGQKCARVLDGSVWCWGWGILGDGKVQPDQSPSPPLRVSLPEPATKLAAGGLGTCAVLSDRSVWCWGDEYIAGRRPTEQSPAHLPARIDIDDVQNITLGMMHVCALKFDGTAWCWGNDAQGSLPYRNVPRDSPQVFPVGIGDQTAELAAGTFHTCARSRTGHVTCWGNNMHGQSGPLTDDPVHGIHGCD